MISIFLAENAPWSVWTTVSGDITKIGRRVGEWAWVGRCDDVAGNAEGWRQVRETLREVSQELKR